MVMYTYNKLKKKKIGIFLVNFPYLEKKYHCTKQGILIIVRHSEYLQF